MTLPDRRSAAGAVQASSGEVTGLLQAWREGDQEALEELLPIVYEELRRRARHCMRHERPGHILQTTALVHEAYLRLTGADLDWKDRHHFLAIAARLMRRVLVELARERQAQKRGGGALTVQLNEDLIGARPATEIVELHEALKRMRSLYPAESRGWELRFFGGLKITEAAGVLGVSTATVERQQRWGRAWLARELGRGRADGS